MTRPRDHAFAIAAALCVILGGVLPARPAVSAPMPVAPADRPIVAVADFYSPGALPLAVVTDLERYAGDVLTGLLVRAGGGALTVLPRSEVLTQQRALTWRSRDALNYGRLEALARALHADRVMLGWITRVTVFRQDILAFNAEVALNIQMFQARDGRIVWQRETNGFGLSGSPDFAAQIALQRGLGNGLAAAVAAASVPVDRTPAP
ncbi:MAG TPA: hypothetical protein VJT33_17730 [bacterium]|nr:hypothetical protein [bacterium]